MLRIKLNLGRFFVIAAVALLLLPAASFAQTAEEPEIENPDPVAVEEETANADNPPPFIHDLVENSDLTTEQVDLMRAEGYGWGNIKLATELAEKIAAQSQETPLTFDEALTKIMDDRSQDIGFGEIAAKYGLKIGELTRVSKQEQTANAEGMAEKPGKPEKPVKVEKMEKPERSETPQKAEKPEMPERGPRR